MAEHVFALVIGLHLFCATEGPCTQSRTDFGVGAHHLGDFGVNVLEEQVVAGHVHVILAVVRMVTAFQQLEQFGLTGVLRRFTLGYRQVALLDVFLLHGNNHPVNGGNVVVFVVVGKFGFGSFY